MRVEDIVERLTILGLNGAEAAVYVHLSVAGALRAGEVAQALGLQRTETYRTLEGLVRRGFVRATDERPSTFEAAPPEALFRTILEAQQRRLASMRQAEADIGPALRNLQPTGAGTEGARNTFKQLQGRAECSEALERLVRNARQEVLWVDTHPAAVAIAAARGTLELLARRAREGVRVRILVAPGEEAMAGLRAAGLAEAARALPDPRLHRLAVADGGEVLAWLGSDPAPGLHADRETAVWSDAADFVATERLLLEALWRAARAARELPPAGGPGAPPPAGSR